MLEEIHVMKGLIEGGLCFGEFLFGEWKWGWKREGGEVEDNWLKITQHRLE